MFVLESKAGEGRAPAGPTTDMEFQLLGRATHHMRHNVVAYLALFLALSGSAMAAKPLIDSSDVQDESLTTADIQNNSLTGDDILESSLGKVPSATTADSATTASDAGTLDSKDSTDFLGANAQAADADKLDGKDSTQFLESTQEATGSEAVIPAKQEGGVAPSEFAAATCPSGTHVTGGGYLMTSGFVERFHPVWSYPSNNGWRVLAANSSGHEARFRAYALCAS